MEKFFLCCIGSLLLCGCAETQYIKAGATQEDFGVDKADCHNQVLMSTSGGALALGAMGKGRGWTRHRDSIGQSTGPT